MRYPDLSSLAVVGELPMPEFNLRVHCIVQHLEWENGIFGGKTEVEPEMEMKPTGKKSLVEVLAQIQRKKIAEAEENK